MKKVKLFILILGIAALYSCKKQGGGNPGGTSVTVYAAGEVLDGDGSHAIYWKNGTPILLPPLMINNLESSANSITVSRNDVYVAGVPHPVLLFGKMGICRL